MILILLHRKELNKIFIPVAKPVVKKPVAIKKASTPKVETPPPQKPKQTNVFELIDAAFEHVSSQSITKKPSVLDYQDAKPKPAEKPEKSSSEILADILAANDELCFRVDIMAGFKVMERVDRMFGCVGDVFDGCLGDEAAKERLFAIVKAENQTTFLLPLSVPSALRFFNEDDLALVRTRCPSKRKLWRARQTVWKAHW